MDIQYGSVILFIGVLLLLLSFLGLRLLWLVFKRSRLQTKEKPPPQDLLIETLRQQAQQRQEAQGAYASLENMLQTIMTHLPSGVMVLNTEGEITFANPECWQILSQKEAASIDALDQRLLDAFQALRKQLPASQLLEMIDPQRGTKYLRVSLNPLPEDAFLMTLVDETRERRLEDQLRYKRDLALMGEMAGGITHEVKNALATIQGHAQLLAYGDVPEHAARIQSEVDHLLKFVREFMKSSQGQNLELATISLKGWLAELQAYWAAHPKGDLVTFEGVDQHLEILGDQTLLGTVVNNLILNGIEACESQQPEQPIVSVSVTRQERQTCIVVQDQGPGFSEDVLPKMFVPFVSSKEKGTGLGLFHCRKLMMEHGGELEVITDLPTRVICHFPEVPPTD